VQGNTIIDGKNIESGICTGTLIIPLKNEAIHIFYEGTGYADAINGQELQ